MKTDSAVKIVPNADALVRRAADRVLRVGRAAIHHRGLFTLLLSGGSTPKAIYQTIAQTGRYTRLDWSRVHLFWGDERCVPPDHADSNYAMVQRILLARIPLPPENVHRIPGEQGAEAAAESYAAELRQYFGEISPGLPIFDLVLLGLGEDGHTASLFPDTPALDETERWAMGVEHSVPPPPLVPRVTVTLPVINAARQIIFLVSGGAKADILYRVLLGKEVPTLPAQRVNPTSKRITWLVDQQAAVRLPWK